MLTRQLTNLMEHNKQHTTYGYFVVNYNLGQLKRTTKLRPMFNLRILLNIKLNYWIK
jgi:hypothetical protein